LLLLYHSPAVTPHNALPRDEADCFYYVPELRSSVFAGAVLLGQEMPAVQRDGNFVASGDVVHGSISRVAVTRHFQNLPIAGFAPFGPVGLFQRFSCSARMAPQR
jgi:hypothetical protein